MTLGELLGNATAETPLLVAVASAVLAVASFVGRRAAASMRRQGARIGQLEQKLRSEQLRRRQLEQVLREDGIPLPYWPDDPAGLYRPMRLPAPLLEDRGEYREQRDDQDDRDDYPETALAARPPVPPFPADEVSRLARHRR